MPERQDVNIDGWVKRSHPWTRIFHVTKILVQGWLRLTFALMKKGGRDLAIIVSMIGLNVMCQCLRASL